MPTFYPRQMPRHLPLTPPDFVPSYSNSCAGQYQQQNTYGGQSSMRHHDDTGYGYSERYDQAQLPPVHSSHMYQQPQHNGGYSTNAPPAYYEPMSATILPPMHAPDQRAMSDMTMQRHAQNGDARATQPKEEKPTGGVSAKLDYDMDTMSDFVSEMAQGMYALLKSPICMADIDLFRSIQAGRSHPPAFQKWVNGVLCATRLPSATILLGLHYLALRMTQLSQTRQPNVSDAFLKKHLTLGLLLGSKFLDDNTFINRSWSEVSGIAVTELNALETEWLSAFDFRLHRDPTEAQGFATWQGHWKDFEATAIVRISRQTKLAPIDTAVQQYNSMKSYGTTPYHSGFGKQLPTPEYTVKHPQQQQSQYSTPAYSHYDPWSARSTIDHSPATSAPITGPTTPEYYGNSTTWAPPEGYSRRTMFGFPPAVTQPSQHQHNSFSASCYTPHYNQNLWNGHPMHCSCFQCARHTSSYIMSSNFASQPVAG